MTPLLNSLLATPSTLVTLTSALIAAAVAILVMTISQYLTFKKGRTDFLTPKLEQLYLLLNELSEENASQFKMHYLAITGDLEAKAAISKFDELEIYGHRRAKKIIMYVRLYFPKLSNAHQLIFAAERELNILKYDILTSNPPDPNEFMLASGRIGHLLMLMEQEIIKNRDLLLKSNIFPRPYRYSSAAEIANERPPPSSDPFGKGNPESNEEEPPPL